MEDCTSIEKMIKTRLYSIHWNVFYLYHNIVLSSRHMQWGGFCTIHYSNQLSRCNRSHIRV